MSTLPLPTRDDQRQRRALQLIFIFVNLVLVEIHLPGGLWVVIGGTFWVTMIALAVLGGSWMCGWVCWIGGVQDLFEPLARARLRINPRWGRAVTLALLVGWVPIIWWLVPSAITTEYTPFGINLDAWPRHLFQLGLMMLVGASVMVLGKRGICRYLCPFNSVVGIVRRWLPWSRRSSTATSPARVSGCQHCARGCEVHDLAKPAGEIIPLIIEQGKSQKSGGN